MCLPKRAVRSTSVLPVTHGQGSTALGKVVVPGGGLPKDLSTAANALMYLHKYNKN
jgi:hypothetical protein